MTTSQGQFVYWLVMKLLLWVAPSLALLRYSGRRIIDVLGMRRVRSVLLWGGGVGLLLGALSLLVRAYGQLPFFAFEDIWSFISGVIIAPIVEEIAFRGAVLGALTQHFRFVSSNLVTALLFLGIHLPGWYFQGTLESNASSPLGGAVSIFLLGLVFGYVACRSTSVSGSIITHILNNVFNV
jgi:membrane protease YdiL (CAAX protease family)